jgi:hypothetical protein
MKPPKADPDDKKGESKIDKAEDLFGSPKVTPSYANDLFSDEPPKKPAFADDLFADDDNDLFAKPSSSNNLFDDDDLFATPKNDSAKGLFDDDDDLFATTKDASPASVDDEDDNNLCLSDREHDGLDAYKAMLVIRLLQVN